MAQMTKLQQKTTTKTTATKTATKPKAATKPEVKTPFFVALYLAAKAGKLGERVKAYYDTADRHHNKMRTQFPRTGKTWAATTAERESMTKEKANTAIKMIASGAMASRNPLGNAVYDLMRMGADCTK